MNRRLLIQLLLLVAVVAAGLVWFCSTGTGREKAAPVDSSPAPMQPAPPRDTAPEPEPVEAEEAGAPPSVGAPPPPPPAEPGDEPPEDFIYVPTR